MQKEIKPAFSVTDELAHQIDRVLEAHDHDATQIVGILLEVQDLIPQRYIPESVAFYIAEKLPVKVAVIFDCLTFYGSLSTKPRAKYPVQICRSVVCRVNESDALLDTLKSVLNIEVGQITYDGRFVIEEVPCFGACDIAPAIRINGKVYGHLNTPEKVREVLSPLM